MALAAVCVLAVFAATWLALPNRQPARHSPQPSAPPRVQPPMATGEVVRVPGVALAIINLGYGDPVGNGATFDVYDKHLGIPDAAGGGRPALPKALIEVTRVGPGFSECRVVQRIPEGHVVEGDLVVQRIGTRPIESRARSGQPLNSSQTAPLPRPASGRPDANPGGS